MIQQRRKWQLWLHTTEYFFPHITKCGCPKFKATALTPGTTPSDDTHLHLRTNYGPFPSYFVPPRWPKSCCCVLPVAVFCHQPLLVPELQLFTHMTHSALRQKCGSEQARNIRFEEVRTSYSFETRLRSASMLCSATPRRSSAPRITEVGKMDGRL